MSFIEFSFVLNSVFVAIAPIFSAQANNIPMLSGTNFKFWKETVEIVLGCMDLDLALRVERPLLLRITQMRLKLRSGITLTECVR